LPPGGHIGWPISIKFNQYGIVHIWQHSTQYETNRPYFVITVVQCSQQKKLTFIHRKQIPKDTKVNSSTQLDYLVTQRPHICIQGQKNNCVSH
jgi:hypothetical protein